MNRSEEIAWRWTKLEQLQTHYKDFRDFYADVSESLIGFEPTWMQYDIADYIANGPLWSMVQAQRGQAKTTIAGCYVIWRLIHDPTLRILILSAGTAMAKQISTWCIQIINSMPELEILRCDKSRPGARASVEAYDVHWMLKGSDKSPSIACLGITSNMQGYRADVLIADDIESSKNAMTQLMREQLMHKTLDFTSINSHGKIMYLGTPQSVDSIYNGLPSRNFDIRIWPGRFPNKVDQYEIYGDHLAPSLQDIMDTNPGVRTGGGVLGNLGQCTDPGMMDEDTLTRKQIDQGMAYFNLQFMLNTTLMDQDKYPLKLHDLIIYDVDTEECPGKFYWSNDPGRRLDLPNGTSLPKESVFLGKAHDEYFPYSVRLMSIDPAGGGQNGDETGISVLFECNGYIVVHCITGVPGGTSPDKFQGVLDLIRKYKINKILVEKNYGDGAYTEALRGALNDAEMSHDIEEVWSTGQKELRIIDSLDPVIGSHKLIIDRSVLEHDVLSTQKYPVERRASYQFVFQFCKVTRDRGSLIHDDRLESLSQGVRYMIKSISVNAQQAIDRKMKQKLTEYQRDPYGVWRNRHTGTGAISPRGIGNPLGRFTGNNLLNRFRR